MSIRKREIKKDMKRSGVIIMREKSDSAGCEVVFVFCDDVVVVVDIVMLQNPGLRYGQPGREYPCKVCQRCICSVTEVILHSSAIVTILAVTPLAVEAGQNEADTRP